RIGLKFSIKLGNHSCALLNRVFELASTIVSVNPNTQVVAGYEVARVCRADAIARRRLLNRRSLHTRKGLTHYEPELGVEGKGTIVVRRLNQTDACEFFLGCPLHDSLHELAAQVFVLYCWVNRNRSNPGNRGSLIQAIASDHPSALFGNNAEK